MLLKTHFYFYSSATKMGWIFSCSTEIKFAILMASPEAPSLAWACFLSPLQCTLYKGELIAPRTQVCVPVSPGLG